MIVFSSDGLEDDVLFLQTECPSHQPLVMLFPEYPPFRDEVPSGCKDGSSDCCLGPLHRCQERSFADSCCRNPAVSRSPAAASPSRHSSAAAAHRSFVAGHRSPVAGRRSSAERSGRSFHSSVAGRRSLVGRSSVDRSHSDIRSLVGRSSVDRSHSDCRSLVGRSLVDRSHSDCRSFVGRSSVDRSHSDCCSRLPGFDLPSIPF